MARWMDRQTCIKKNKVMLPHIKSIFHKKEDFNNKFWKEDHYNMKNPGVK